MLLPFALTMPAVTEKSKENGDPIATTQSPTCRFSLSPIETVGNFLPLIFSTARSDRGSIPTTSAENSLLSLRETVISSASSTT